METTDKLRKSCAECKTSFEQAKEKKEKKKNRKEKRIQSLAVIMIQEKKIQTLFTTAVVKIE